MTLAEHYTHIYQQFTPEVLPSHFSQVRAEGCMDDGLSTLSRSLKEKPQEWMKHKHCQPALVDAHVPSNVSVNQARMNSIAGAADTKACLRRNPGTHVESRSRSIS
ncbi:hypothetical protein E2C01_015921 [Portunus trituberculatus]|uniref:Uncharacterized protein n=1 Tax=Portunus trituberculatus TaxID=210409 RepID=A0A5B7DPD8_PORTR|nr:hypothetical protein [Portunus trituberculatus]